ncbi:MAG: RES family NAD+ phosphorylase [Verrucomicrobiota bacterium]
MPVAWRIVPKRWARSAFDGEGARLYGGRWNSPGKAAVYMAESRALAALETLVHHSSTPQKSYLRFPVEFGYGLVEPMSMDELEGALNSLLVVPETQAAGDRWLLASKKPVLEVPSAIIPEERNYILNPYHEKFQEVYIGAPEVFAFDPRLVQVSKL